MNSDFLKSPLMDFRRNIWDNVNTSKEHKWDFNEVPWAKKEQFWVLIFPLTKWENSFIELQMDLACVWASKCLCKCVRSYHTKTLHGSMEQFREQMSGWWRKSLKKRYIQATRILYTYNTQICTQVISLLVWN